MARTPKPPYYAVIFTSTRTDVDDGYAETAARLVELASQQPGFLGVESVRQDGLGITVSYWESEESIRQWKQNLEHRGAQESGRSRWHQGYHVRVARVERAYSFGEDA